MNYRRRTKRSRKLLLWRVLFATILVLLTCAATLLILSAFKVRPHSKQLAPTTSAALVEKKIVKIEPPIRLEIPIIGVNAAINYVGIKSDGTMDIKPDQDKVAWYEFGPRPGEKGSAVIAGHYGWLGNKGSVFNNLNKLKKGDQISVVDESGSSTVFIVTSSQEYDPTADTSAIFKSYDGKSHLNLITCDGVWENNQKTYSDRLVVFSDKET